MDELQILMADAERFAVVGLSTESRFDWPPFFLGESVPLSFSLLSKLTRPTTDGRIWKYKDISTDTVKVSLGLVAETPLAGSWVWQFGSDAIVLNYDDDDSTIQTKVNAGTSMTAAGGCTIRHNGEVFICTFNNLGNRSAITGVPDNLSPTSTVQFGVVQEGDSTHVEVSTFQLMQRPVGLGTLTGTIAAAGGTVTTVETGGTGINHKIRVALTNRPYSGSFALTIGSQVSDNLSVTSTVAELRTAIEALSNVGTGNVSVLEEDNQQWLLTFIGAKAATNMGTSSGNFSALISRVGKTGVLDLEAANVQLMLRGREEVDAFIEFEVTPSGGSPRKYQRKVTFRNSLFNPGTLGPVQFDVYYTQPEVDALLANYALLASPAFTGTPTAPTAAQGTNTGQLATTSFVHTEIGGLAPLASPTFTGTPTAPTASVGNNTGQLATTAFVHAEILVLTNLAPSLRDTFKEISDQLDTDETAAAALVTTVAGKQAGHANLTAFSALTFAANKLPYLNASSVLALADLTAAGRALLDDADAAAQRTTLGLVGAKTLTQVSATADYVVPLPSGSFAAGDQAKFHILASGADRNLKMHASIIIPQEADGTPLFDNSAGLTMLSSKKYLVLLEYDGSSWLLVSLLGKF